MPGKYFETAGEMSLSVECPECGTFSEIVEKDVGFFKKSYESDGYLPMSYLIFPVTYRCNLKCKFCYTHSNYKHLLPKDRTIHEIESLILRSGCPVVNLAGGEPTVRKDLPLLLSRLKSNPRIERICVVTNGQRTVDIEYLKTLRSSGMDFLFLPVFVPGDDDERPSLSNVLVSLANAHKSGIPVWIQATVDRLEQIDYVLSILEKYRRVVFNATIRAAAPYGIAAPEKRIFISDILRHLGMYDKVQPGNHPFNKHITLFGRKVKLSSWVNDRSRNDPFDAKYVVHDNTILPFHKGMIYDDLYFKKSLANVHASQPV